MSEKLILNLRKELVKISKYSLEFLVDKNDKIYVRWKDLEAFNITKNAFKYWLLKKDKTKKQKVDYKAKYDVESYFTKENDVAVEIIDGLAICCFIESMEFTFDSIEYNPVFSQLYSALQGVIRAEKEWITKKNERGDNKE